MARIHTLLAILVTLSSAATLRGEILHEFTRRQLSDVFYCEGATYGDLDGDGDMDIVSGPFWYEGPGFTNRHEYYPAKPWNVNGYSDNFFAFVYDFDGDADGDILIIGFPGQSASWFENPGPNAKGHWPRHLAFDQVDNESPWFTDLTGDGRPEIVCNHAGRFGYAEYDPAKPRESWRFTPISTDLGKGNFTHGLGVGDVDGDGRKDVLERDGWFRQPASLEGAPEWSYTTFGWFGPEAERVQKTSRRGGAQMHTYDVDADGDLDVITSLDAHGYGLAWYEQVRRDDDIAFQPHILMHDRPEDNPYEVRFTQLHALELVDMDGDGLLDILTGKRHWAHQGNDPGGGDRAVVYWFRLVRGSTGPEWIPHRLDDDSGVGTQVVAGDVTGDGLLDVVVGNKKGTFLLEHSTRDVSRAEWVVKQPKRTANTGLDGHAAAANMTVPEGFHVRLVAGEPDVHQPIAMTIDHRGRIWVIEGFTYPQRRPDGQGQDDILVFEDTDDDGTYDRRTVFTKGVNLASGIAVGFGGVWVGAAPYLLFFPDADDDAVADGEPEIVLDGWGYHDTHETLNSFTWGPDGWLYGCHGVFTHSRVGAPGTPDEERVPINAGVWRFHPQRRDFEVFAWGTSNPWGVDFDDQGEAFITACVIPHLYHVIPGARYERQAGGHFGAHVYDDIKTIADHLHHGGARWTDDHFAVSESLGGGHAHCGAMVYLGDNFPAPYRGKLFMNNIHGNRVNVDRLEPRGSGWVGRHDPDFLLANDKWFRGIHLELAPDGSVVFIDWYDAQACHRREIERWDRKNGRVFKVAFGEPEARNVDLSRLSDVELARLQLHDNDWHVRQSRRLLQEKGAGEEARAFLAGVFRDSKESHHRLRALWALAVTGHLADVVETAFADADAHVRRWAVRLSAEDGKLDDVERGTFRRLARSDSSPVVRLALASALQRLPADEAWPIALALSLHDEDAEDHNLPLVLWYGIEPLVAGDPAQAATVASRARIPTIRSYIARRLSSEPALLDHAVALLGRSGDDATVLAEILRGLEGQRGLTAPPSWKDAFRRLSSHSDAAVRERVQELAIKFGDERIFPELRRVLGSSDENQERRSRALAVLREARDPELAGVLISLLGDAALRGDALRALAAYDDPRAVDAILAAWKDLGDRERVDAATTLASRPASALRLLEAVASGGIASRELSAFIVRQIGAHGDPRLDELVSRVWGAVRSTDEEKVALIGEWKGALTPEVLAKADSSTGRDVFARTCATCHALFGSGGTVGPDLTGSNRADLGYLLENMLDPNAVVGRDYQMQSFILADGQVLSGLVLRDAEATVRVRTVTEEIAIPKDDIVSQDVSQDSLMPEGLVANLRPEEVRDLVAYLASPVQVPRRASDLAFDEATRKIPGVVEAESMKVLEIAGGTAAPQGMGGFPLGRWSGDAQLWWMDGAPGSRLVLKLDVPAAGRYALSSALTGAPDYAVVRFFVDDQPLEGPIDRYVAGKVVTTGPIVLGEADLEAGSHRFEARVVGTHPDAARRFMVGIDFVGLRRVQ